MKDNPEEREQIAYFKALALCEGRHPAIKWIHASMNGASASSKAAAARRKAQGQKRGISDVLIPFPTNAYHGAFLEFKSPTGRPTPEQKAFLEAMTELGYLAVIVRSCEEALKVTGNYLGVSLIK